MRWCCKGSILASKGLEVNVSAASTSLSMSSRSFCISSSLRDCGLIGIIQVKDKHTPLTQMSRDVADAGIAQGDSNRFQESCWLTLVALIEVLQSPERSRLSPHGRDWFRSDDVHSTACLFGEESVNNIEDKFAFVVICKAQRIRLVRETKYVSY